MSIIAVDSFVPDQYAAVELEFSKTRTGDFLHLARKLEKLPRLKKEMEEGKIGYTKAREIVKVADGAARNCAKP